LGLNKKYKLLQADEFNACFQRQKNKCFCDKQVMLLAIKNNKNTARIGFALAKKNIKKASSRNLLKRIITESFRANVEYIPNYDMVVLAKNNDKIDKKQSRFMVDRLWKQLIRYYQSQG
jgi:ribonuclease P protein component